MRTRLLIGLIIALAAAPAPPLTARWDSAISATIAWSGHACLSVAHATGQRVFIGCFDGGVRLGGPQTDGAFRPQSHDVYVLDSGERAVLVGRAQYLAVWR